jgi:DNA mismatch endonuclease (patch repair protein)
VTDIFTKKKRSEIMSRIRSVGTKPEQCLLLVVRRTLGHRWRIDQNVQCLPGRPDFVIPSLSLIIFVDGCFYHGCPVHGHDPKSNQSYWVPKLKRNQERDRASRRLLQEMGFAIIRFWEHDLLEPNLSRTKRFLARKVALSKADWVSKGGLTRPKKAGGRKSHILLVRDYLTRGEMKRFQELQ